MTTLTSLGIIAGSLGHENKCPKPTVPGEVGKSHTDTCAQTVEAGTVTVETLPGALTFPLRVPAAGAVPVSLQHILEFARHGVPHKDALVDGRGHDQQSIRRDGHAGHPPTVALQCVCEFPRVRTPHAHRLVPRRGDDRPAVRRHRHARHPSAVARQRVQQLAGGDVREVRPPQVRTVQHRPLHVCALQICVAQVRAEEVRAVQRRAGHVDGAEVQAREGKARGIEQRDAAHSPSSGCPCDA